MSVLFKYDEMSVVKRRGYGGGNSYTAPSLTLHDNSREAERAATIGLYLVVADRLLIVAQPEVRLRALPKHLEVLGLCDINNISNSCAPHADNNKQRRRSSNAQFSRRRPSTQKA